MFGEYAVYYGEKVIALICDDQIYIKPTESGKELISGHYEDAPPYPGAKPFLLIGDDVLEDRELLCCLITQTAAALPMPKPKKLKRKSKTSPSPLPSPLGERIKVRGRIQSKGLRKNDKDF
jgi:TfoX/Sxy family transcriptional regulator of competence genes